MRHPDEDSCDNSMSLNQARRAYERGRIDMIRFNKPYSEFRNDGKITKNVMNYRGMYANDQRAFDKLTGMQSRFDHKADEIDQAVERLEGIAENAENSTDRNKARELLKAFR